LVTLPLKFGGVRSPAAHRVARVVPISGYGIPVLGSRVRISGRISGLKGVGERASGSSEFSGDATLGRVREAPRVLDEASRVLDEASRVLDAPRDRDRGLSIPERARNLLVQKFGV